MIDSTLHNNIVDWLETRNVEDVQTVPGRKATEHKYVSEDPEPVVWVVARRTVFSTHWILGDIGWRITFDIS